MRARLILALAMASAAAVLAAGLGSIPAALAPLVWLGCFWVPGLALSDSRRLRSGGLTQHLDALWIPLATGPVLFGLLVCAGCFAGLDASTAAVFPALLGAGAAAALLTRGGDTATAEPLSLRPFVVLLGLGLLILLVGSLPSLTRESLRIDGDARLHLPLMQRVQAGGVPPENPFLAGEPAAYFWFYHATLGAAAELLPLPRDRVPAWFNAQALALILLATNLAGRRMGLSPLARGLSLVLVAFGLSAFGFARLLQFRMSHPELSWPRIRAEGTLAVFPLLSFGEPRLAAFLTKIAVTNALPMSLALGSLALIPARSSRDHAVRFVAGLGAGLFHLAAGGLFLAGMLAASLLRMAERRRGDGGSPAVAAGLAALALAALVPYAIGVLEHRAPGTGLALGWTGGRALDLHLSLAGIWILTLPVLMTWLRGPDHRARLLAGSAALGVTLFARLIDGNEYKGIFVLLIVLAPVAAAGLERLVRGRVVLAAIVLLPFLPGTFLTTRTSLEETPPSFLAMDTRRELTQAQNRMPEDAVIWRITSGGTGYFPYTLHLGRTSYLSDPYALRIMGQWTSPTARRRASELAHAAQGQAGIAIASAARDVAPRPLFVLVTEYDRAGQPTLVPLLEAGGAVLFARGREFQIYSAGGVSP